jgi:hypothetical protein
MAISFNPISPMSISLTTISFKTISLMTITQMTITLRTISFKVISLFTITLLAISLIVGTQKTIDRSFDSKFNGHILKPVTAYARRSKNRLIPAPARSSE